MSNNQNNGYQSQQNKNGNQVKDNPQAAGQKDNQKTRNAQGANGQDKKNLSGSDSDSEQE